MSAARDRGISSTKVRRAVRQRLLVQVLRGVYLRADVELTTEVKLTAAARVISAHSIACDRTAAWIWGVGVFEYGELDATPPLETYVLRGHTPTERPEVRGGTRDLLPEDWVEIGGVKVTTPLRTALDLGCKLNRRPALAAMDALMRAHGFTHVEMRRLAVRFFRRRGVVQLRELIPLADPRAESPPESWTRLALIDHGLPARSRSTGSRRAACRRSVWTWLTHMPASRSSTTARSSTRPRRTGKRTGGGGNGWRDTAGRSSWSRRSRSPETP